jgi:hypothetical protein
MITDRTDQESYIDILRDYPAIDNHAHPLLTAKNRDRLPFEGLTSEAAGTALEDAVYTLAHSAARRDLALLYGLPPHASWEDVKENRGGRHYDELCRLCFNKAKIQCILIDDGLGGVKEMADGYQGHDKYTTSPTWRIVRVEVIAEVHTSYHIHPPKVRTSPSRISSRNIFEKGSFTPVQDHSCLTFSLTSSVSVWRSA